MSKTILVTGTAEFSLICYAEVGEGQTVEGYLSSDVGKFIVMKRFGQMFAQKVQQLRDAETVAVMGYAVISDDGVEGAPVAGTYVLQNGKRES
jgi:hypothetical protein